MKTSVIATLPTGSASFVFEGEDWLAQAKARWPDATTITGTPLCRVCGMSAAVHEGSPYQALWCDEPRPVQVEIPEGPYTFTATEIQRVIREAVEAEREACARVVEESPFWPSRAERNRLVDAIRARGQR